MSKRDHDRLAAAGGTAPVVQIAAMALGAVVLILGVAGFIPGITSNFDELHWAGRHSGALLLGLFAVSVLHNLLHLGFGIAGLVLARSVDTAKAYLFWGGAGYTVLWLYGLTIDHRSLLNILPVNGADNWLHLGVALAMLTSGAMLGRPAIQPDHP